MENKSNDLKLHVIDKRCQGSLGPTPWYFGDGTFDNAKLIKKWNLNKKRIQPRGKQSPHQHSWGCFYTRTTGIWQTVWVEAVDKNHIKIYGFESLTNPTQNDITFLNSQKYKNS